MFDDALLLIACVAATSPTDLDNQGASSGPGSSRVSIWLGSRLFGMKLPATCQMLGDKVSAAAQVHQSLSKFEPIRE
jgi:hypothetical protein